MPKAAGKWQKMGVVEQVPSFGAIFSPHSSRSRIISRSGINSRSSYRNSSSFLFIDSKRGSL